MTTAEHHGRAERLGVVTDVCLVDRLRRDAGAVGVTAIDKRPADGPVRVGPYGLRGDVQADRQHHGGLEKALYAYDQAEADHWAVELDEDIWPGRFGENLRIDAARPIEDALIGERWRIGDRVEVEVTGPRTPCATFGRWLRQSGWVKRFSERARTGVYLRVIEGGELCVGDEVVVVARPDHGVTVARWFARKDPDDASALLAYEASCSWAMADYLRKHVRRAAGRAASAVGGPGAGAS